jgi:proteasome lid subunit RPN8/RPN11
MALLSVFLDAGSAFAAAIQRSRWLRHVPFFRQRGQRQKESEDGQSTSTQRGKFVIREKGISTKIVVQDKPSLRDQEALFLSAGAFADIVSHISWGKRTPENINEQGGLLIGMRCETPTDRHRFVVVTHALPIRSDTRSSAYIKFDHAGWHRVLSQLDLLKDQGRIDQATNIIGWYHTHPQQLDCFMSGTDLTTQRSTFYQPWNYALVLNPHRKIMKCFVGGEAASCPVIVLA